MNNHIRTDTFKVFKEEDEILSTIIRDRNLSITQGKSEAYRIALQTYKDHAEVPATMQALIKTIEALNEKVDQLYFIVQGSQK